MKERYLTPTERKVIEQKCKKTGEDPNKRIKIIEDFLNKPKKKIVKKKKKKSNNLVYDHVKRMYEAL